MIKIKKHTNEMRLQFLLWFNALSATAGGLYLISNPEQMPLEWLDKTGFTDYYFAGVILFAVVGGSALIAALAWLKKLPNASLLAITSAVIMLFWIAGEIASIRHINFLQLIYFVSAFLIIYLTPKNR